MTVILKKELGKDCITVDMPDSNNITVTGDFLLQNVDEPTIDFTVKLSCRLTDSDVELEHDITYIEPEYESIFNLQNDDIMFYFNTLIRIVNFRMNIEIKNIVT